MNRGIENFLNQTDEEKRDLPENNPEAENQKLLEDMVEKLNNRHLEFLGLQEEFFLKHKAGEEIAETYMTQYVMPLISLGTAVSQLRCVSAEYGINFAEEAMQLQENAINFLEKRVAQDGESQTPQIHQDKSIPFIEPEQAFELSHNRAKDTFENLKKFKVSGNDFDDTVNFLKMTGRIAYLPYVENGNILPVQLLLEIKLNNAGLSDPGGRMFVEADAPGLRLEEKYLLFRDIPKLENEVIENILNKHS